MTRERKTQIATIGVLCLAAILAVAAKNGWRWPFSRSSAFREATPQGAIYSMLDAARTGDVKSYPASYTGQMQAELVSSVKESTPESFARYLRDSNAAIKGVAVNEPENVSDREAKVRVEYIYQDRNEVQIIYMEMTAAGWKIARADGAERIKTLVPFGTPVK
jgi:hypothetical protein